MIYCKHHKVLSIFKGSKKQLILYPLNLEENDAVISTEGLAPGEYRVSYFVDGAYNEGAFANFTLVEASQNPPTSDSTVFMTAFAMLLMAAVVLKRKSVTSF